MSKELTISVEGRDSNNRDVVLIYSMTAKELLTHVKQMVRSIAQTGFIHEIEDRKNPFNGIRVDYIEIMRSEDFEFDDDDNDDDDDIDDEMEDFEDESD